MPAFLQVVFLFLECGLREDLHRRTPSAMQGKLLVTHIIEICCEIKKNLIGYKHLMLYGNEKSNAKATRDSSKSDLVPRRMAV